jgi:hypothetical protein
LPQFQIRSEKNSKDAEDFGVFIFQFGSAEHEKRHRRILVAALRVVGAAFGRAQAASGFRRAILAGDGSTQSVGVLGFLASFHETVIGILTTGQPWFKLDQLKETLALTEVLSLLAPIGKLSYVTRCRISTSE